MFLYRAIYQLSKPELDVSSVLTCMTEYRIAKTARNKRLCWMNLVTNVTGLILKIKAKGTGNTSINAQMFRFKLQTWGDKNR